MTVVKGSVLFFLTSAVRGGAEEVAVSLARGFAQRGWETHLAAPGSLLRALEPDLDGTGTRVAEFRLWSWRQVSDLRRFVRYLRDHSVQIVNSHLFYATAFAAPLARLASVPVVVETAHGAERWRRSWWKRAGWIDWCVQNLVTVHIAVSEAVRRYLVERKHYPPRKVRVVPNGCDPARFAAVGEAQAAALRRQLGIRSDERVILFVGRLEPQKDPLCLLTAFRAILTRFPTARLVFAGDGGLRAELQNFAAHHKLDNRVTFTGVVRQIETYYAIAELVVLPSLYEGMPLVALEAGAAGRPIVATAVDGTSEVVQHGRTGLLIPPRDPQALCCAVSELLADPGRGRRIGAAAQQRVSQYFSLDAQVRRTEQVFEACLLEKSAA